MNTMTLAQMDWDRYGDTFQKAIFETLYMVSITLLISSVLGLIIGLLLYTTRKGGILQNRVVYWITNFLVNFIRPIPFIILPTMAASVPIRLCTTRSVSGPIAVSKMMNGIGRMKFTRKFVIQ